MRTSATLNVIRRDSGIATHHPYLDASNHDQSALMEARRDPRGFIFFIILLLLLNSPEPQQSSYNARTRYDELIQREFDQLDILNRTHYGDFDPKEGKWLNFTGLRAEDGFAWEVLGEVKEKARAWERRLLGDGWENVEDVLVYRNLSGFVQGEWVRLPLSRVRHPDDMGNLSMVHDGPFAQSAAFDRNLTGMGGSVRFHFSETEDRMRQDANHTISEVSARVVIGDDDSFGGNWWEFIVHGVHFLKSGAAVLTTTSDRFAGIFALPHMQIEQRHYDMSQQLLNGTIHEAIDRQRARVFPLWNPWSSSAEGLNEGLPQSHHCEFVLYLQQLPIQYSVDLDWLEHEMRYPTGAPIPHHSPVSMSMVGFSPDCGFVIESKGPPNFPPSEATHLWGEKTEAFNDKARHGIIAFAVSLAFQISFLIKQMKETATPSMRSRVSFYTIAMMALGDGFTFLILIFMYLFLGTAQLALYSIAFMALFSVLTHLRFLMDIWSVQAAERERQNRQQATPATPAPTPASPAVDEGLPLPVTASRPRPPTPIIIAPDQDDPLDNDAPVPTNTTATAPSNPRAELGTLYSRFCLLLVVLFFTTIQFGTTRTTVRSIYFSTLAFLYLSFWVPQIYRNIIRNCRQALRWEYVIGTSITRLIPIAYFWIKGDNVMFAKTDWRICAVLVGWIWLQIVVLVAQAILGPRIFVKQSWSWVPEAWEYHPLLHEDEEDANMPLNVTTSAFPSSSDASEVETSKAPGETKRRGKKVFDCSICAQDIDVPILSAGESADGMGSTGMLLQRRMYMVTPCRHVFHTGCLEGWMRYRLMCPNCREVLPPL